MNRLYSLLFSLLLASYIWAADRPNVIVVLTDDQGYGELSCHGNPVLQTPSLDRLAAESIRLIDFHVTPVCAPTRGQLLTGIDAFRNGATNVSSGRALLRRGLPTMADVFAADGYQTALFGKWHLGDNYPYRPQDRGFQQSIWFPSSHINSLPDYWNNDYFDDTFWHDGRKETFPGYCTDVFFTEAKRWMSACAAQRKPFFTYLALNAPHWPHFVPDQYRVPVAQSLERSLPQLPSLSPPQQRDLVSYLAMIANIDDNMGRLDQFLSQSGLRDNTIMVFMTDNGSPMGPSYFNAGMRGGKFELWEGGHRVPCFIRWPRGNLRPPGDVGELTEAQDLLPTLIDLCGINRQDVCSTGKVQRPSEAGYSPGAAAPLWLAVLPPSELPAPSARSFDGVSLAPLLRGEVESLPERMLVVNYSRIPDNVVRTTPDNPAIPRRNQSLVMWKRWRLLEDKELYNLDSDPRQEHNVIQEHPEVADRMRRHLDEWWNSVREQVNEPERVIVGSDNENPSVLTACEWFDVFLDQQQQVRRGERKNGLWNLEVAAPGEYEIVLRRWPREAGLELNADAPAAKLKDGEYPAGLALPIAAARLQIGRFDGTIKTAEHDREATFRVVLARGPTTMQTWFLDAQAQEISGAYYVSVHRL